MDKDLLIKEIRERATKLITKGKDIMSRTFDFQMESYHDPEGKGKHKWIRFVVLAGILVFAFYLGGCLAILGNPYRFGGSFSPGHALWVAFTSGFGIRASVFMFFALVGFMIYLKFISRRRQNEDDRNFSFSSKGVYGTSRFASQKQISEYLEVVDSALETDGIIIGKTLDGKKVLAIPKDSPYNRNICVCGSQGTNKSIAFARNMIIQCAVRKESFFVTDPKAELFEDTVFFLKQQGYDEIYQWNLINRWNSNGWDVLQEIKGDEELEYVDVLCNTIIRNTTGTRDKEDFFDKIETVLLKALVLYVVKEYPSERRTLGNVYNMLLTETTESLDAKFSALPLTHPARGAYNLFSKSPLNKGNAILGLGARLNIFQSDVVQKMTGFQEIDMEAMAQRKVAVFCIASDSNATYNMLNALFISMMFIKIMAYADRQKNRKCDIPVHIILDEFPNLGVIDSFKQKEATARSRDIGISILFQNIPQLQNRYPDGVWEELIGGCDFRMLFGCNETTTSEYFSKMTGTSTIEVETQRKNLKTIRMTDFTPEFAQSAGVGQRATMLEDEIRRLGTDELLLFVRGQQPVKLKKFKFYQHPAALAFRQIKAHEIIPKWRDDIPEQVKTANSLESLVKKAEHDQSLFVVQDSVKYGFQRTALINELCRITEKYRETGHFPDGLSIFNEYGLVINTDKSVDKTEHSVQPEEKSFDSDFDVQAALVKENNPESDEDLYLEEVAQTKIEEPEKTAGGNVSIKKEMNQNKTDERSSEHHRRVSGNMDFIKFDKE